MGFFHWVTLYHNLMTNLYGDDQEAMLAVINDDTKFDKWLRDFSDKRKREAGGKNSGKKSISNEEYLAKYAPTYGG